MDEKASIFVRFTVVGLDTLVLCLIALIRAVYVCVCFFPFGFIIRWLRCCRYFALYFCDLLGVSCHQFPVFSSSSLSYLSIKKHFQSIYVDV